MGALGFGPEIAVGRVRAAALPGFDFGGALPAGATLARASAGTRHNPAGVLVSEAINVARFDHDPATLAPRGLLIEEQRSNGYIWSDQLQQAAWVKNNSSAIADATTAPDGSGAADLVVPAAAAAAIKGVAQSTAAVALGATVVHSGYFRAAGYPCLQVVAGSSASFGTFYWNIDLSAGVETAFAAGTSSIAGRGIVDCGGGWYRLWIAVTAFAAASGTNTRVYFTPVPSGASPRAVSWASDGTSGVQQWGMQAEIGAGTMTSYIATGAATATRSADVVTLDWGSKGVGDGPATVRYRFDDGSAQEAAATVAGGTASVPTSLARGWLTRAERL